MTSSRCFPAQFGTTSRLAFAKRAAFGSRDPALKGAIVNDRDDLFDR